MSDVGGVDGRSVVHFARSGFTVGAGLLLTPSVLATCAHVVAESAGLDDVPEAAPHGTFTVDLPFAAERPTRTAWVTHWAPPEADGSGDVALLQLDEPVDVPVPAVRRDAEGWGASFRSVGFPPDREDGVWVSGEFRARQAGGWLQLVATGGEFLGPGFSGAPVWDVDRNAVVAMAVAADLSADGGAYALPIDRVLALAPDLVANPYRGVAPFGPQDAEFFFGRDLEITEGIGALVGRGLLVLAGGSGSGKSSLLAAGIVPAAERLGRDVRTVRLAGAHSPDAVVVAFAAALDAGAPDGAPWAPRLTPVPDPQAAADVLTPVVGGAELLVVVDQLEELGPLGTAAELIVALAAAGVWVAATARWATFDDLPGSTALAELQRAALAVTQLGRADLRSAVAEPAARVPGPSFEPDVIEAIVEDARDEPGRLPLVAALLSQLWAAARDGGRITMAHYRKLGGVEGALLAGAEKAWHSLDEVDQGQAERALVSLATATDGGFVRRPAPVDGMSAARRGVIDRLAAARLVTIGPGPGGEVAELAHQSLIDRWTRLRGWLREADDFVRWRTRLRADVGRWTQAPGADLLLRGAELEAAREWVRKEGDELEPAEREFVVASEYRHRRNRRVRYSAVAVVVALAVVASVLTVVVSRTNGSLRTALATATARSLGQLSRARLSGDVHTATQMALAAYAADPGDADARSALGQAYLARLSTTAVVALPEGAGTADRGLTVDRQTDPDVVVAGSATSALIVDGITTGHPTFTAVPGVTAQVRPLLIAGRGRFVVLFDADGNMQLWDRARGGTPRPLPGPLTGATTTSDDDHLVITASVPGGSTVRLLDLVTGESTPLLDLPDPAVAVSPTADPNRVLVRTKTADGNGPRTVRDVRTGAVVATVPPAAVLADNGRVLVECATTTDGLDSRLVVSDTASGTVLRQIRPPSTTLTCRPGVAMVTGDTRHVAWLPTSLGSDAGADNVQLVDVTTGTRTSMTAPRSAGLSGDDPLSREYTGVGEVEKVRTTGFLTVIGDRALLVDGTVLDLLGLSVSPAWRDTGEPNENSEAFLGGDGSYALVARYGEELVRTVVPGTGQVLGRLTRTEAGLQPGEQVYKGYGAAGGYVLVVDGPSGRRLLDYSLPALHPTGVYALDASGAGGSPEPPDTRAISLARTPDRLVALSGGVLSWWSTRTHDLVGPPATITSDQEEIQALDRRNDSLELGDPAGDSVVFEDRAGVQTRSFGDPASTTLPLPLQAGSALAVLGARIVTLQLPGTINLYDRATRTPSAVPSGLPVGSQLIGTDSAGDVVTIDGGSRPVIRFWSGLDLRPRGQVTLNTYSTPPAITADRLVQDHTDDIDVLSVDATVWRDHLCGTQDRAFTPAETALLPVGADTRAPCHQG